MSITLIRVTIMYLLITFSIRLMGRRQVGELQATELVITILLSEIIAMPIEDNEIPILNSVVASLLLVSFEILSSVICMKSEKIRKLLQGNPIKIIDNGTLKQDEIKNLRLTLDDILESLREKDCFDINEVQYAILETNGKISIQLKPEYRNVTNIQNDSVPDDNGIVCPVICDGKRQRNNYEASNMNDKKIDKILKQSNISQSDVLLLTANKNGLISLIVKEKK